MRTKQTKEARMLVRVDEFNEQRVADFTHKPLTPVDKKFGEASGILKKAIKDLGGKAAIQASGEFGQQTEEKRTLRQDLEEEMRNYNRTAASIAEETKNPGLLDRFRMPQGSGDGELKTKARAFAMAIRELSLNDEFEAHGHGDEDEKGNPIAPDAVLDAMADEFQAGEGSQGNARSTRAGATQAIPVHLREGKGAVKTFDAIYGNVYKDDAGMLAAWRAASHVERTGTRTKKAATTPVGAATPGAPSNAVSSNGNAATSSGNAMTSNGTTHDLPSANAVSANGKSENAPSPNAVASNGATANGTTSNRVAAAS